MIDLGESLNWWHAISHRRFNQNQASGTIPAFSAVTRNTAHEVLEVKKQMDYTLDAWQIREYMVVTYKYPKKKTIGEKILKWFTN